MLNPKEISTESLSLLSELITCCICKQIAKEPMNCKSCNRIYCKECIEKNKMKCSPHCNSSTFSMNEIAKKIIEKLKMKCKNGCGALIPLSEVETHYLKQCPLINYKEDYTILLQKNALLINEMDSLLFDINKLK